MSGCPLTQGSPRAHRGGGPGQKWARGGVSVAPGALHPAELTQRWQVLESKSNNVSCSLAQSLELKTMFPVRVIMMANKIIIET